MRNLTVLFVALTIIQISCSSNNKAGVIEKSDSVTKMKAEPTGGICTYEKFEGTAKIKSITPAPASEYNCPDKPYKIVFEFTPSNIADRQKYRFTNFSDSAASMQINDGANPSHTWIKKNKIEVGKKYKCIRTELTKGTCTPVGFTFPELNLFPEEGCN